MPRVVLPPIPLDRRQQELPDLDGFAEAQDRLRRVMGRDVVFRVPGVPVWPDDTVLDPQTRRPYDPTIQPVSGRDFSEITKRVSVVWQPIRASGQDQVSDERLGVMRSERLALAISDADYGDVEDATEAIVSGITYRVTESVADASPDERHVMYLEAQ